MRSLPVPLRRCAVAALLGAAVTGVGAQAQFGPPAARNPSLLPAMGAPGQSVAVGDLDNDGSPDVVTVDATGLSYHSRAADGTRITRFIGPVLSPAGAVHRVQVLDLDGDGDPDLLTAPRGSGRPGALNLWRNTGGVFARIVHPLGTQAVEGVDAGDVDGDGDVDLLVGLGGPGTGSQGVVLLRQLGGAFVVDLPATPPVTPAAWPRLGDFDGDGDLDALLVGGAGAPRLFVNSGGTFADATASLPTMGAVFHAAVGDFDADGAADCAFLNSGTAVHVLWGGAAGLSVQADVVTGVLAERVYVGDFDGDGRPEFATTGQAEAVVLQSLGARQFSRRETMPFAVSILGEGVVDVDGDGRTDLVLMFAEFPRQYRCFYAGLREFEDAGATAGVQISMPTRALRVVDVDGDGRRDVLVPTQGAYDLWRNRGHGRYETVVGAVRSIGGGGLECAFEWLDFDFDGDLDAIVDDGAALRVHLNDGTGIFTPATQLALVSTPAGLGKLSVLDVDGDGDLDAVRIEGGTYRVVLDLRGAPVVRTRSWPVLLIQAPSQALLADFDGDGDPDMLTDGLDSQGHPFALVNNGQGVFGVGALSLNSTLPLSGMLATDLEGDGDVDLIVTRLAAQLPIQVLENDGAGRFADVSAGRVPLSLASPPQGPLFFADFDDDGDRDLVLRDQLGMMMLLDDGSGALQPRSSRWSTELGVGNWATEVVDVDGDGDLDFVGDLGLHSGGVAINYTRQLVSRSAPTLGRVQQVDLFSGPGYSRSGFGLIVMGLAARRTALPLPGYLGGVDLDLAAPTAVLSLNILSPIGVSSTFVQIPGVPAAAGIELFLQGVLLPGGGLPGGLTNSLREVLLP